MYIPGDGNAAPVVTKTPTVSIIDQLKVGIFKIFRHEKKNVAPTIMKNLILEEEDYKIDADMTVAEKLQNGWRREQGTMYYMPSGKSMEHIKISMLIKKL
jgi:hypothetical protein